MEGTVGRRVGALLDELTAVDLAEVDDASLEAELIALATARQRLDAELARRAAVWHRRGIWSSDGSRSAAARLSRDAAMSKRTASSLITHGAAVAEMPHVAKAWSAGRIGADHVTALLRAAGGGRRELFTRDERMLVSQSAALLFSQAMKALDYWRLRADVELNADGPPPPPARYVRMGKGFERTVIGDFVLDPIGGATVRKVLRRIERRLARHDRQIGIVRGRGERTADALVEMAELAAATRPGARRPAPLITILAGEASIEDILELSDGTVLAAGDVIPHLERAMVQTFIFDGADRVISSSKQRTFTGTLRRAIQVRDRHCQHPAGCDAPIDDCDLDHTTPWSEGGHTSHDDGKLGCQPHNRNKHLRDRAPTWHLEAARWRREDEAAARQRVAELKTLQQRPPPTAA